MLGRLLTTAIIAFTFTMAQSTAAEQRSEGDKFRLEKKEILDLMAKSGPTPSRQQNDRLNQILKNQPESGTPRSDFLFCMGLAYWNNSTAQICVGKAYETGRGIVEDLSEAYTWYSLASSEADQQRVQMKLQLAYPSPSDEELAEQVKTQQDQIKQNQVEAKKEKK